MNKTEIINNALLSIGEDTITDIDSVNEPAAKVVKNMYDQCRKVVLSSADWPFVMVQEKLIKKAINKVDPDTGAIVEVEYNKDYPYVFALPTGYLYIERLFIGKINETMGEDGYSTRNKIAHNYINLQPTKDWDIKFVPELNSNCIVSKFKDNLLVEYVKDMDTSNLFSDLFNEALTLFLAYKLCMPIKKDVNASRAAYQLYETFMQKAEQRMLNEMRDTVPNFVPEMVRARGDYYDYKHRK